MPLVVREAVPAELDAVGRLTLAAYVANGYVTEEDYYAEHLLDAGGRATDGELYVGVVEEVVVGTVTFCPEGSELREVGRPGEGEFRMLAVSPSARRRGVAAALVERCVDRSLALGYDAVVLSSLPAQVEAHALYGRMGFVRVPERDWSPAPGIDLLGFRLAL